MMDDNPIPLGIYRHYKGNEYEVLGFARHSETLEDMVVYKARGENDLWVRPLSMWGNTVEINGKTVKRFEFVGINDKKNELAEARRALLSTLQKCEKIDPSKLAASQKTLLKRRIAALHIALGLIDDESAK